MNTTIWLHTNAFSWINVNIYTNCHMNTTIWLHTNAFSWINVEHLHKLSFEHNDLVSYQRIPFVKQLTAHWWTQTSYHGSENVASYQRLLLGKKSNTVFTRVIYALFSSLTAEKSGCVKYADFLWRSWSGFYSSIIENTVSFINILL
jgi:hypothetical protein